MRAMTKSPLALAREALEAAQEALPTYTSPFSRKDFTQHQLFAILVLREFLRTDYRGIVTMLEEWSDLRQALGIKHRPTFRKSYLHPAMERGLIEYTIPDKPRSRLQQYRLTGLGRRLLEDANIKV